MSYYSKVITVPKNTSQNNPFKDTLDIQFGVIHRVHVSIPSGHAGLTGVRLLKSIHQIAPTSGSEWFTGDDSKIEYNEYIEIPEGPFSLNIEAYNEDDTYDHTFIVGVGVLPAWALLPSIRLAEVIAPIGEFIQALGRFFGMPGGK